MNAVSDRASVAPRTVTAVSKGEVSAPKRRRRSSNQQPTPRQRSRALVTKVDERIMAVLRKRHVDFHYVEVRSPTEVVIHNEKVR